MHTPAGPPRPAGPAHAIVGLPRPASLMTMNRWPLYSLSHTHSHADTFHSNLQLIDSLIRSVHPLAQLAYSNAKNCRKKSVAFAYRMNVLAIVMMIYQLTRSSASAKRQHVTAVHATRTFPGFLAFSFSCLRITSSIWLNPLALLLHPVEETAHS